jgi:uncharacterized protein DUF6412
MGFWMVILALSVAPGGIVAGPAGMVAVASCLAAGLVLLVALQRVAVTTSAVRVRAVALRQRSRRLAFLKLRDPDAPGRSRPRAPCR